tara:strand:+ start:243 stop:521 length:279 start_codon:yes stop_codon:yes gene_type:complete
MKIYINNLKTENEILKRLLKDGTILINYDSTDCDGCSTSKVLKFNSLEEIYKSIENESEYADGSFSYSIPVMYPDGSLSLNKEYNGGSWANY